MIENLRNANRRNRDRQRRALNAPHTPPAHNNGSHEEASREQGLTGTISFLNSAGMWGFIRADGNSYFFHATCLEGGASFGRLTVGDHVVFEPTRGKKGLRAECVRPV